ncbi:pentapeptide repeat-containing protein (plasmid) [Nocardia sp. NBC_01377]|uniref:pentapeptide repeat-containing protein n=1 Tax=Nocardia sp. NBC_01377 TaxID=2903595 RepID=UPI0032516D16
MSDPPAATGRFGRLLHWPGWVKVAALATIVGTLGASGAAIGALWFTGQSLRATNSQISLAQQTAVTDRFRLAADQLASDKISVRISGIYLFERLAKDSPADHPTVFAVLAAFLRTQTTASACGTPQSPADEPPADIQTALTVIGRREVVHDTVDRTLVPLDLRRTCLSGADLDNAHLAVAFLHRASLIGANLIHADLTNARLTDANLTGVDLRYADMTYAHLIGADLTGATLTGATLINTKLTGANLAGVDLRYTNMTDANLTDANLTGTMYDNDTRWPEGFTPPPSR